MSQYVYISVAQLVETYHALDDSISLIDRILDKGLKEEDNKVKPRAGRGVGAVEAPRGILFHDYTYNDKGLITKANCIILPIRTTIIFKRILEALVPQILINRKMKSD